MSPLTNAEKQRRFRERQKLRAAGLLDEPVKPEPLVIPTMTSLSAFIASREPEMAEAIEWMRDRLNLPVGNLLTGDHPGKDIEWTHNVIRDLETSLSTLTGLLSEYWVAQIDHEIARMKAAIANDPAGSDEALNTIVRLTAAHKSLEKTYRISLRNYEPEL